MSLPNLCHDAGSWGEHREIAVARSEQDVLRLLDANARREKKIITTPVITP